MFAELRSAVRDVCAARDAEAARARAVHCENLVRNAAGFWTGIVGGGLSVPALAWAGYTDPVKTGKNSIAVAAIGSGVFACYHAPRVSTGYPWMSLIVPCGCGAWIEVDLRSAHDVLGALDQVADGAMSASCHHPGRPRRTRTAAA